MTAILSLHDRAFDRIDGAISDLVLPTLARLVFAGTLLMYFWASAATKLGNGLFGWIRLDMGAYIQMFPRAFEAAGFNPQALPWTYKLIALAGTWAEFLLPLMIVIGLLTRLAALGMIGFIVVMSATDIVGHGVDPSTIGAWFDRASDAAILDQRAFWVFLLLYLALRGGGPLSVDRFLGIGRTHRAEG
jgi:putative oxidoreductase